MAHPITAQLEKLDPPLAPGVSIEVYCSGVHKKGPAGFLVHAFGLVFHLSDGRIAKPVCSVSRDHETTNDRAELGGTLTAMEWLGLNAGKSNPAIILSAEEYIYRHLPQQIGKWARFRTAKNLDLIDQIFPHFRLWPDVQWQRAKFGLHPKLHKEANQMANRAIDALCARARGDLDAAAAYEDAFVTVDDEFWMKRAIDRDRS